jgi:hypothetical protein
LLFGALQRILQVWHQANIEKPYFSSKLPMIENPYMNFFFKDATQKSARVVPMGIALEFEPREPIFEKCSHLREKGGALAQIRA